MPDLIQSRAVAAELLLACLCWLAFGLCWQPAWAADLDLVAWPNFSHFGVRDGLPESVVYDVQVDRTGFVWAATQTGLYRYDGHRWTAAGPDAVRGQIRDLYLDHRGRLWVATDSRGLAWLDAGRWSVADRASGFPSDRIYRVAETVSADGSAPRLWIGTGDIGALRALRAGPIDLGQPGQAFERIDSLAGVAAVEIFAIARTEQIDGGAREWLGSFEGGLYVRKADVPGERWEAFEHPQFRSLRVRDLRVSTEQGREVLWIATYADGLYRYDGELQHYDVANAALQSNLNYEVAHSSDQTTWIASKGGLTRLRDGRTDHFDHNRGLPVNAVRSVSTWRSPDGVEVLWIGTETGVSRALLNAIAWHPVSTLGSAANGVWSVLVDTGADGKERLWVAPADSGLKRYQDGAWHAHPQLDQQLSGNHSVRAIRRVVDASGTPQIWIGAWGGELLRVNSKLEFERIATPWLKQGTEAPQDLLARIGDDGQQELWVGNRVAPIARLRGGQWQSFPTAPSGEPARVSQLVEQTDARGRRWLWASSFHGVLRFDGQRWQAFNRDIGLPDPKLIGVTLRSEGARQVLWFGGLASGVTRVDITDPQAPRVVVDGTPQAPHPTVYGTLADRDGNVYVCSNRGVQRLSPVNGGFRATLFLKRDGLVHDECNSGAMHLDARGRIWVGGLGGLSMFDPQRAVADLTPKPLVLTQLELSQGAVRRELPPGSALVLPSDMRELHVHFALLAWMHESDSRFRTQLLGFDEQPSAWSQEPGRSFGKIPAGSYQLRIEALDHAQLPARPLEIDLQVLPAWWETWKARLLFGLLTALLLYASFRWRLRFLRARSTELEALVAQRTEALRATAEKLDRLSLEDELTGIGNRRFVFKTLVAATEGPAAESSCAVILIDVDHFKRYNDRYGHVVGDAVLKQVAGILQRALDDNAVLGRYGGEEFLVVAQRCTSEQALALGRRLCDAVSAANIPHADSEHGIVTISAGCACDEREGGASAVLTRADRALYAAKQRGRNDAVLDC